MTITKILSLAGCCVLLVAAGAIADRGENDGRGRMEGEKIHANLIGWQEVPSIASGGTAVFRARIADDDKSFDWELTYSGLTDVTQAHIHVGERAVSGNIFVWLCGNSPPLATKPAGVQACPTSAGTITGTATAADVIPSAAATAAQSIATGEFSKVLDAIRAGVAYANIHTLAHPPGEIRGQISHSH